MDVIVVGAGAAGLMVARELKRVGYSVEVLEASDRVGGRIRTVYGTNAGVPIELGAEFIHGEAPITRRLLAEAQLVTVPVLGRHVRSRRGAFVEQERVWKRMARVFERLDPDRPEDRSFQQFLEEKPGGPRLKQERELARGFVQGFNAADAWLISEKSLAVQGNPTQDAATSARIVNGYAALIAHLGRELNDVVRSNNAVRHIRWGDGHVQVATHGGAEWAARACVITVPLPMLQDQRIVFEPDVPGVRTAARQLVMGHAVRVNVIVRQRFWQKKLEDLSFVHTPERPFNAWWTMYPLDAPVIVGWSGGPPAVALLEGNVEEAAITELARAFGLTRRRLEPWIDSLHTHDWSRDASTLGAYSYVGVGGIHAAKRLAEPVGGTLFFAGEATDRRSSGTVEGALASAQRAVRQVVARLQ